MKELKRGTCRFALYIASLACGLTRIRCRLGSGDGRSGSRPSPPDEPSRFLHSRRRRAGRRGLWLLPVVVSWQSVGHSIRPIGESRLGEDARFELTEQARSGLK
jgi:hypothetical protein